LNRSPGARARAAGFSLLELVIALSLVALIVSIGAISYASGKDERVLRETAVRIEAMSSRGHAMSILHQKPFWLSLGQENIALVGADVRRQPVDEDGEVIPWEEEELTTEITYEEFVPNGEIIVSLRRWGAREDDWVSPGEDLYVNWQFQNTGLCEPVAIRIEKGESYIVMYMHPLTARVEEEDMLIK
jgi:prepilin-type N-terminal cleavage/methylation domain-containing protein